MSDPIAAAVHADPVVKAAIADRGGTVTTQAGHLAAMPTSTEEEDRATFGQRRINLIWETTQAVVTIIITFAAVFCAIYKIDADVLNFAFVAVISTYYARTNHTKVGGIKYEGR